MDHLRLLFDALDSISANYGKPVGEFRVRGQIPRKKKERTEARSLLTEYPA